MAAEEVAGANPIVALFLAMIEKADQRASKSSQVS